LKFKKLEKNVKVYKKSIIYSDLTKIKKELERVNLEVSRKNKQIEKIKKGITSIRSNIEKSLLKINSINSKIQKSTGLEQEKLNQEIANIRAELAGLNVKIENYENKLSELRNQKTELKELISKNEESIKELREEPVTLSRKNKDIELKKQELEEIEKQRRKFYTIKSELKSVKQRLEDKKSIFQNFSSESEFLLKQISQISNELFDKKTNEEKVNELKIFLNEKKEFLEKLGKRETELKKITYTDEYEIEKQEKLKEKISKIDICPVCKSKVTKKHIDLVKKGASDETNRLKKEIEEKNTELNKINKEKDELIKETRDLTEEISRRESDLIKLSNINDKKEQIKILQERIEGLEKETSNLEKNKVQLEKNFNGNLNIEQKYETLRIEVQEISLRSKENVSSEISFKQKELERSKISLKQLERDEEDLNEDLGINQKELEEKENILEKKKEQEEELSKKFEELISEREELQKEVRKNELKISEEQNLIYNEEQEINKFNIDKARIKAGIENFEIDILGFEGIEIIKASKESLIERLEKTKESLSRIGAVNLLSLDTYDSIKKEYDSIKEKSEIIEKEKINVLKIIHEIDLKKKKTFLKTLESLNEKFSRNFSNLSFKGVVSLEVENKKDPFEGGVNILVKTGHGKYFDITSLSGGEQTLVALSLIFAIQELKPYCFHILDEIDAALDKRNSERLALLLKKYMQKGQYIVITHNDEIITNASNLYGVSMHEGISKIVSMKL
jgi:chromosome segregation protein